MVRIYVVPLGVFWQVDNTSRANIFDIWLGPCGIGRAVLHFFGDNRVVPFGNDDFVVACGRVFICNVGFGGAGVSKTCLLLQAEVGFQGVLIVCIHVLGNVIGTCRGVGLVCLRHRFVFLGALLGFLHVLILSFGRFAFLSFGECLNDPLL